MLLVHIVHNAARVVLVLSQSALDAGKLFTGFTVHLQGLVVCPADCGVSAVSDRSQLVTQP